MFTPGGQIDHLTFAGVRGGGKGGGGLSPMMMWYLMQQQQQPKYTDPVSGKTYASAPEMNAAIDQRSQQAQQASDTAAQQAAAQATANENAFQANKQAAYNTALQNVMQTFQGQGVDPANYMGYITPQLQSAMQTIPDLASNPASYFPTSLGQTILNQATGDRRTQLLNTLNQTFSPSYAASMVPTTTMDKPIQDILAGQFDPLQSQLTNAYKRGTLTDIGYGAAQNKMAQARSAAESQLRTLGSNIINQQRGDIENLASGARSDIANMTLGQNIDPSSYFSRGSQMAASDISGFPGALQSAAGNVTFADIQDLLNAGGAVQGANNPTAANPMIGGSTGAIGAGGTAMTPEEEQAQAQAKRGLGSTGAF